MHRAHALRFGRVLTLALLVLASMGSALAAEGQAPVDINSASAAELKAVKGIGDATATKIISNRPYKSLDDLGKAGLSAKKIEKLRPYLTVGGGAASAGAPAVPASVPAAPAPAAPAAAKSTSPTGAAASPKLAPGQKVSLNRASLAELEALPGIGPKKAQAIIDGRPYKAIEDVMKVKGIKQGVFGKIKDHITVD